MNISKSGNYTNLCTGSPKSTVCSMFVRFCKAGLSWPLPAGLSERELDARLYGSASTVPVALTER
ncbi:hypothetical protein AW067_26235 [Escherichia coli]|nr:hypothetical protein AW067_26235 [Escherichia coli]